MTDDNLKTVVYDVDDTLWSLNGTICDIHGLDLEDCVSYGVMDNPILSEEDKKKIYESYGNPDIFKQCRFYEGYERIFDLEQRGMANVWISSANLNEAVRDIKKERLENEIPNVNVGHIRLTVANQAYQGRVPGYILIDDSIVNISRADFAYNILIDMPYNRNMDEIERLCSGKNIIRVHSLIEAVDMVEKIIMVERG